ncbi:MAG TPA: DUF4936 family protein [Burkholderiales bacterium]
MALTYCIYYRVGQPGRARKLAHQILSTVQAGTGIAGRLLQRRDDPSTWMEIYENVDDAGAFERCLAAALGTVDFTVVLQAGDMRHMECFEDTCA